MDAVSQWLVLLGTPGLGPTGLAKLLGRCGSPAAIFDTDPQTLKSWGLNAAARQWLRRPDHSLIERDLALLQEYRTQLVTFADPYYPQLLKQVPGAPPVLFVRGNVHCLGNRQLAMVGSRQPSPGGRETARELAYSASMAGFTITSGLARGIDAAAHRGALDAERPTIGVMGTGPERIYPACHQRLAEHIIEHGALISEFPPGVAPQPANFPRRNRIISGMAIGTLVVEAALRSGSLITARLAGEQGREVLAVPGSIHNPVSRGCHQLLREGARLVESVADILQELDFLPASEAVRSARGSDGGGSEERPPGSSAETGQVPAEDLHLLELMGYDHVQPDQLIQRSGLTADAVCSILFSLEIQGFIKPVPGGAYVRVPKRPPDERKRT